MNTTELISIILVIVSALLIGITVPTLIWLLGTVQALKKVLEEMKEESATLSDNAYLVLKEAQTDLRRVDDLLDSAGIVAQVADSASRLAYNTFSNPVIKAVAIGTGTARAVKRLGNAKQPGTVKRGKPRR
ncbi:MAG: hypothetical protein M1483_08700 [Actinobacteria bacterium]|nr:hypothetical protein [Actinomycetota bacterium]MCL6105681.1 hypothetical protein [Actinomycetota bacterium]